MAGSRTHSAGAQRPSAQGTASGTACTAAPQTRTPAKSPTVPPAGVRTPANRNGLVVAWEAKRKPAPARCGRVEHKAAKVRKKGGWKASLVRDQAALSSGEREPSPISLAPWVQPWLVRTSETLAKADAALADRAARRESPSAGQPAATGTASRRPT